MMTATKQFFRLIHINWVLAKHGLDEIVTARLTDIFELIDVHLKSIKRDGLLPAGVILTGGGSGIATVQDLAKAVLRLPSRTATLDIGKNAKVKDSSWAVAYGLCMWGASGQEDGGGIGVTKHAKRSILNWISQFLP